MNGTRSFSSPALLLVALSFSACETGGPFAPPDPVAVAPAARAGALNPANTIEVTALGDAGSGGCTPEECTLREAVAAAAAAEGADRITFSPALATRTIVLDGAPLFIDSDILIDGSGGGFTVDADGRSRVLDIPPGVTVEIVRGTITGGSSVVNGGGIENLGSLILVNSTIYGNAATGAGAAGGGIYSEGGLVLSSSTVAGNSATEGGGLYLFATGASISNSVLGGNTGGDCAHFFGSVADGGYNLVQAPGGCTFSVASTRTGIDPLLRALGDNGGLSLTAAPQTGSPLIDGGSCTLAADQRGLPRPVDIPEAADAAGGNGCDIGALEVQLDMGEPGCTLEDLRARVVALGPEGDAVLNGGQTNALTRKVDQAARLRGKDKIDRAIHLLSAFRQQVSDLATEGVLSGSEAGAVDECAAAVVEEVSGA